MAIVRDGVIHHDKECCPSCGSLLVEAYIILRVRNHRVPVAVPDITAVVTDGRLLKIVTERGPVGYLTRSTLRELQRRFPRQWLRVHRGALVNPRHVQSISLRRQTRFGGWYELEVRGCETPVPVSRRHASAMWAHFNGPAVGQT